MPAHTTAWNEASPVGSDLASSIDDFMRAMKLDIRERMALQHYWNAATAEGNNQDGTHKEITLTPATTNIPLFKTNANQSLTGSNASSAIDLGVTWNTSGAPTAIKVAITNTASGAASKLIDITIGGSSIFDVEKNGDTNVANTAGFYSRNSAGNPTLIGRLDGSNFIEYGSVDASGIVGVKYYGVTSMKWILNIAGPSSQTFMELFNSGILHAGSAAPGAIGAWRMVPNPGSPVGVRHEFGTDNSGWQMRFAKNHAGAVTDLWGIVDSGTLFPVSSGNYDIGSSGQRVRAIYTTDLNITDEVTGNLVPDTHNTYDLGTSAKRWRTVYATDLRILNGPTIAGSAGSVIVDGAIQATTGDITALTGQFTAGNTFGSQGILNGAGVVTGARVLLQAGPSRPGTVELETGTTVYSLWVDSSGKLRIGSSGPTDANGSGGTIVGTQV